MNNINTNIAAYTAARVGQELAQLPLNQVLINSQQSSFVKPPGHVPDEMVEMTQFNHRAGIHQQFRHRHDQRAIPLAKRRRGSSTSSISPGDTKNADTLTGELESAADKVIDDLQRIDRSELEGRLTAAYDPLQRHTLLRAAQQRLRKRNFSKEEESRFERNLQGMIDDLMARDGDAINGGLKSAKELEDAIGLMEHGQKENQAPATLTQLRSLYGAGGNGQKEAPVTPLGLTQGLLAKFGPDNFMNALSTLRSRMAKDFRKDLDSPRKSDPIPRLWLSLSDATSFNAVQSCYAISGDLRRSLSTNARVVPGGKQTDTMLTLLSLPDSGGNAESFATKIVPNQKEVDPYRRHRMFTVLREWVNEMPGSLWEQRNQQRSVLMEDLKNAACVIGDGLPQSGTKEMQFERKLRGAKG